MTQQVDLADRRMAIFEDQKPRSVHNPIVSPQIGRFEWPEISGKFSSLPIVIFHADQTNFSPDATVTTNPPSEEVANSLACYLRDYLNITFMGSARQLFFDDAARTILRAHAEAITELVEQQSIMTMQLRSFQEAHSHETLERVALGPFSDRIEQAGGVALDEVGVRGAAEFDGARLTFRIPPESEDLLIEGEFNLYRVLVRELPINVFRALDIDTEILE